MVEFCLCVNASPLTCAAQTTNHLKTNSNQNQENEENKRNRKK